jgi:hypothetical protein
VDFFYSLGWSIDVWIYCVEIEEAFGYTENKIVVLNFLLCIKSSIKALRKVQIFALQGPTRRSGKLDISHPHELFAIRMDRMYMCDVTPDFG